MTHLTLLDDATTQGLRGGFLNKSFNRTKTDNRQINVDLSDNLDQSNNSVNTDNSVKNKGFFSGNTIKI
jgi:hypothetical protein